MLPTLIFGCGRAALTFHLPAVRALRAESPQLGPIGAIDPFVIDHLRPGADIDLCASLSSLSDRSAYPPEHTVVHICTPPDSHIRVLARCAEAGYRRFIIEKPLADRRADLDEARRLIRHHDLDVLVVANWLASHLTDAIEHEIASRGHEFEGMTLRSWKSRIGRSLESAAHTSAFEVEMPHLVALATRLLGDDVEFVDAWARDLVVEDRRVPMMGGADVVLRNRAGCEARLSTNLQSPVRNRSVLVAWSDGTRLVGHYPCDSTDLYSQLELLSVDGVRLKHRMFEDDTVRNFIDASYRYFEGAGPRPRSNATFHTVVTDLLLAARERAAQPSRRGYDLVLGEAILA